MICPSCQRLKAELDEAREEVAAWKAYDSTPRKTREPLDKETADFICCSRRAFGTTPALGRLLHRLLRTPGDVVQHVEILDTITREPEEKSPQLVNVQVCHLRSALATAGICGAITNERGLGYALSLAGARAVEGAMRLRAAA